MPADIPVADLLKAIAIYLKVAYPDGWDGTARRIRSLAPTTTIDEL